MFLTVCILSGCDYLPNIKGMGSSKVFKLVSQHRHILGVLSSIRLEGKLKIPKDYEAHFWRAYIGFNF